MKAGSRSFRRALAIQFAVLNVVILGALGIALYIFIYRTTTRLLEDNLRRTTETVFGFVERVASTSVTTYLHSSADRVHDLVAAAYGRFASGELSEAAARKEVFRELSSLRIGQTGYAYILDTHGFMVYHPSPGMNDRPAPSTGPLAEQLYMREGYLQYYWRNPEEATTQAKAMYMSYFAPWRWILTVTSYRKEFDELVRPETFRDYILSLTFGRSGYVFIARLDGALVVHPKLTGNPLQETGDPELQGLFQTMRQSPEGSTTYSWRNPGEASPVKKVIYFKQLPGLQWVVGSTIPISELYAPASRAGLTILLAIMLAAILAVFLSASLAALLTRPIEALADRLEQGAAGDFSIRMVVTEDEIGKLAAHFNRFMDGLQAARDRLADSMRERTQAEAASARLAAAVGQIDEHVLITDAEGSIIYVNHAFELGSGYTAPEVMGQSPRVLKSGRHEAPFFAEIWATLKAGKSWQGRMVNRRKDGVEYIQEGTITPIRDDAGSVVSYLQVCRDITREVEREVRERQRQKLEAVGTLAGGIAHDFNNVLAAVLGFSELAEAQLDASHPARESLTEIVRAATRARDLVAKILTFSRQSRRQMRPVRMDALLKDTLSLLRASLPTTIRIEQALSSAVKPVLADSIEMHQLVMNLCTNAAQAIGERPGTITVTLRDTERPGPAAHGPRRDAIELTVQDDGAGMSDEVMARMFEPFFTTKRAGQGTGLGLAVVHGIVSQMEGEITAESAPGKGTLFRIVLPCLDDPGGAFEPDKESVPPGAGERILLVDDEDAVRSVAERVLVSLGYRVTTASRAALALSAIEQDPEGFDLLLTDQTMPEMTGVDLARVVSVRAPALPVVLMTGSREVSVEEHARQAGVRALVNKPFRRAEIAVAVRRVLDDARKHRV